MILIKACQDTNPALLVSNAPPGTKVAPYSSPIQLSDPQRDLHITLTRPHTALLLAAVREGMAYRGVFTGAMAYEFKSAEGRRDIYIMFTRAAAKVEQNLQCSQQHPEFESTAKKALIFPPSTQPFEEDNVTHATSSSASNREFLVDQDPHNKR